MEKSKNHSQGSVCDVSVVMITFNEADSIGKCLERLHWCRDIVVVDSGSTDSTMEICKAHGARVFTRAFNCFGPQKRFAVSQAKYDWVLSIDADEIVSDGLAEEISSIVGRPASAADGYYIPSRVEFMGKVLQFGPTRHEMRLRFFRTSAGTFNDAQVHESVSLRGRAGRLRSGIIHRPYRNLGEYFTKFNDYTNRTAHLSFERGKRTNMAAVALTFPESFFVAYVLRGGALDGYAGFIYCFLHAVYRTVKYARLLELQMEKP